MASNELAKLPEKNWRRAYHEAIADEIEHLRNLRRDPLCRAYREVGAARRVKSVVNLTDPEIEELARLTAEKTLDRALHRANAT